MKTKLLFTAALMAAAVAGTQAVQAKTSTPFCNYVLAAEEDTAQPEDNRTDLQKSADKILDAIGTEADGYAALSEARNADTSATDYEKNLLNACLEALKNYTGDDLKNIDLLVEVSDFTDGNTDGWTVGSNGLTPYNESDASNCMRFYNEYVANKWWNKVDYYKSKENLPNGWYQVQARGFYRATDRNGKVAHDERLNANNAILFGDDGWGKYRYGSPYKLMYDIDFTTLEGNLTLSEDGKYPNTLKEAAACIEAATDDRFENTVNVYVSNNTICYGFAGDVVNNRWWVFDDVRLIYKGNDKAEMWDKMKTQAKDLADKISTEYGTVIDKMVVEGTDVTVDDIKTMNSAILETKNVVAKVAEVGEVINTSLKDLLEKSEADQKVKEQLTADANTIRKTSVASVTEAEMLLDTWEEKKRIYMEVANPVGDVVFNMTYKLTNPQMVGNSWVDKTPDGWYHDLKSDDFSVKVGSIYAGDTKDPLIWEYLQISSSNVLTQQENGNGWAIYQKTNLPEGKYKLTAEVFGEAEKQGTGVSAMLAMGVGDNAMAKGEAISYHNGEHKGFKLTTVSFGLSEVMSDVKLGVFVNEDNGVDKFGINDIRLYKVAPQTYSLDEISEYNITEVDNYANVTMSRTLKGEGKWNTFCVPFDMTAEQIKANGITEVRVLSDAKVAGDHATLTFDKVTAIEAGKPYIVKVSEEVSEIKVNGVAISSVMKDIILDESGISITMRGNYSATTLENNEFFISDNAFYLADTKVSLKGFRAYIEATTEGVPNNVNRMLIDIDGVTTSVEEVLGSDVLGESQMVDVYSLSGVKLKGGVKASEALEGLPKGIYVVGGKKVIK